MTTRPLLFSAPMVRALLAGRKTQTRRLTFKAEAGDLLWVKETWTHVSNFPPTARYYATDDVHELRKKRPSIYMPRWASRITLEVTEVRCERLQEISGDDAEAEGITIEGTPDVAVYRRERDRLPEARRRYDRYRVGQYQALWDSINGKRPGASWADNPIVVAITFDVHRTNVDQVAAQVELTRLGQATGGYDL